MYRPIALHWLPRGPAGHGGPTPTIEAGLALCFLHVSQTSFHLVLDRVVFSLATPVPSCDGQKCLESSVSWCAVFCSPGIDSWRTVFCLTVIYSYILHKSIVSALSLDRQNGE